MSLDTCEMWSNSIKIAFYFKQLRKVAQRLGALPQTLVCDTLEMQYTSLFKQVYQIRHFRILTIGLSPLHWTNSQLRANTRPRLLIFDSTISLPPQKIPFSKFLMTSLHVICGLPPIKNPGYAYRPPHLICTGAPFFQRPPLFFTSHWVVTP